MISDLHLALRLSYNYINLCGHCVSAVIAIECNTEKSWTYEYMPVLFTTLNEKVSNVVSMKGVMSAFLAAPLAI